MSPSESIAEFIDAVRRMRELQRKFFATRSSAVLTQCKEVEAEVDQRLRAITPANAAGQRELSL